MISLNPKAAHGLPKPILKKSQEHWDSIFRQHVKFKNDRAILKSYVEMQESGISPTRTSLPIILKACTRQHDVKLGRSIHCFIAVTNLMEDVKIGTSLVEFYCKCGLLEDAHEVFLKLKRRDLISWNVMMWGCVDHCHYGRAIGLFKQMEGENLKPSSVTLVALISACTKASEYFLGKEIHGYCLRNGFFSSDVHVGTSLIGFYSNFSVTLAVCVFKLMAIKNIASCNALLGSHLKWGSFLKVVDVFIQILVAGVGPDLVTLLGTIQACAEIGSVDLGKQVHQFSIKSGYSSGAFIENALVNMYGRCNQLDLSSLVFETMTRKDLASWNAMISTYRDAGFYYDALDLFKRMRLGGIMHNEITICTLLSMCSMEKSIDIGLQLHGFCIKGGLEFNKSIGVALIGMYVDFNLMESAEMIFSEIPNPDVVSWNAMIMGLLNNGLRERAFFLFREMDQSSTKPNAFTMVSLLSGCNDEASMIFGRSIHCYILRHEFELDSSLCTTLIDMYMNCGCESAASYLFSSSSDRDLVSWNALIASKVRNGKSDEALQLLSLMRSEVEPNSVTMMSILSACADTANLPQAKCIHAHIIRREFDLSGDVSLRNAILTMYAKCGSIENALTIFERLPRRDAVTWNAIIAAFGMHGRGKDALDLLRRMLQEGLKPTNVTFVSALSACSHSGLVEEGWDLFHCMSKSYNILPNTIHYACMVDLLARVGKFKEARELIASMPIEPDASVFRALLGACRVYSNTNLATEVAESLIKLEPKNIGNYILLSNIHAAAGNWETVKKLRREMVEKGLGKNPGKSWIVVRNSVHSFRAGDRSHPQTGMIYRKLNFLLSGIAKMGYCPDSRWVLHELEEEEKGQRISSHSEKLAISFGLLSISSGAPIIVNKNLRVCGDCHEFCKHVSKFVDREIILRDNSRFHHFSDGFCSCRDYW